MTMFHSLRGKLIAATLLIQIAMIAVLAWNGQQLIEERLLRQFEQRIKATTPLLSAALITPMIERDFATAKEILMAMQTQEDFAYLVLSDAWGKPVAAEGRPLYDPLPPPSPPLSVDVERQLVQYDARIVIEYAGQRYGELAFGIKLDFLQRALREHLLQILTIAVFGTLASALLLIVISLWLTRHLKQLTQASEALACGHPHQPLTIASHDEIGTLARSFESMAATLGARDAEQRAMLNNGIVGIVKMRNRHFVWANQAFEQLLGYGPGELNGHSNRIIYPDDAAHAAMASAPEALQRGEIWRSQVQYRRKDGTLRWFDLSGGALPDGDSLWSMVDITDLKHAIDAAEEANRAKSRFLGNMSHELRTPLNGVLGMTQLLMTTALSDEQQDYAAQIKLSTADLLRTINDLLDISKLETGRIDLENVEFNLGTLLHETLPALEMQARAKGLIFGYYLDPALPGRLRGDPRRLAQILANLVGNAIKFTDQGKVAVSLSGQTAADGQIRLHCEIRDSGIGIPAERLPDLFAPFHQVDASTTRRFSGSGLGLSIAKRLVEMMGGAIGVDSLEGQGSTFWFDCPCIPAGTPPTPAEEQPATFDAVTMLSRLGGDRDLAQVIVESLIVDMPKRLADLVAAAARDDAVTARREAHTLKGLADTGGNATLRQAAFDIQLLCEDGNLAGIADRLPYFETLLAQALAEWRAYLASTEEKVGAGKTAPA